MSDAIVAPDERAHLHGSAEDETQCDAVRTVHQRQDAEDLSGYDDGQKNEVLDRDPKVNLAAHRRESL
ncbi:MAG: hypothetical protein ACO3IB_09705, partial [Phycisphaerales bacterium]